MRNDSREEILNRIREGLYGSRAQRVNVPSYTDKKRDFTREADEIHAESRTGENTLAEQFVSEAKNVNTNAHIIQSDDEVKKFLLNLTREKSFSSFSIWETDELKRLGIKKLLRENGLKTVTARNKNRIAGADVGITEADYAIADTGTLVLLTDKNRPRSVSLLPPVHLAIVKKDRIVNDIKELFEILKQVYDAGKEITSCMSFITGPSRTADIELNLTLGVHGPKELYVLVLDSTL